MPSKRADLEFPKKRTQSLFLNFPSMMHAPPLNLSSTYGLACADIVEVPPVCIDVQKQLSRVPTKIEASTVDADVARSHGNVIFRLDVVLRADVHEAKGNRGQTWDRIVVVRNAVVATRLIGDIVADLSSTDAGSAEGVLEYNVSDQLLLHQWKRGCIPEQHYSPSFSAAQQQRPQWRLPGCARSPQSDTQGLQPQRSSQQRGRRFVLQPRSGKTLGRPGSRRRCHRRR